MSKIHDGKAKQQSLKDFFSKSINTAEKPAEDKTRSPSIFHKINNIAVSYLQLRLQ